MLEVQSGPTSTSQEAQVWLNEDDEDATPCHCPMTARSLLCCESWLAIVHTVEGHLWVWSKPEWTSCPHAECSEEEVICPLHSEPSMDNARLT